MLVLIHSTPRTGTAAMIVTRQLAARTLNVVAAPADGRQALVSITASRKTADYAVTAVTKVERGWLVGPAELPDDAAYLVTRGGACSCPAGLHGKACKHTGAVAKLVELRVLAG